MFTNMFVNCFFSENRILRETVAVNVLDILVRKLVIKNFCMLHIVYIFNKRKALTITNIIIKLYKTKQDPRFVTISRYAPPHCRNTFYNITQSRQQDEFTEPFDPVICASAYKNMTVRTPDSEIAR